MIAAAPPRSEETRLRRRRIKLRRRDAIAPVLAIACLLVSQMLYGAAEPKSALLVSAALILVAVVSVALAGPRLVTPAILVGAIAMIAYGATGLAGPLHRAMPDLASLFAAGSIWTVGYVAAQRGNDVRIILGGLVWASLAYAIWYFFSRVAGGAPPPELEIAAASEDAILFGIFALVGSCRFFHVIKQLEAESLSRSEMIDRLLRDALGGLLLLGFSITCLLMMAPRASVMFIGAALLLHAWWDTRAIASHSRPGGLTRLMSSFAPLAALALAIGGAALSIMESTSAARAVSMDRMLYLDRLYAYGGAWLNAPVMGNGLGSVESVGDRIMSIWNADALMAPGGARNALLHMLVESGVFGVVVLGFLLTAMHVNILAGMADRKSPRTVARLALAVGVLLLLNGAFVSSLDTPGIIWLYALLLGAAYGHGRGEAQTRKDSTGSASSTGSIAAPKSP